jgi:hypothetical protein
MPHDVAVSGRSPVVDRMRARAPAYWRYMREKPSWLAMFLFARTLSGRRLERWLHGAGHGRAGQRRAGAGLAAPITGSILPDLDPAGVVGRLIEDGVYVGLRLPDAIVRDIRDFADSTPCFPRDQQDRGFLPADVGQANRARERDIIAAYYFEAVEQSPTIRDLGRDAALLAIAAAYLGHRPVLIRTRLWWSFPGTRVSDADLHAAAQEKFHFDMNGWRTLKFFFYLTQVDEASGPHRCIVGSHRIRSWRHQISLTVGRPVDELIGIYGRDRFLAITGPAGLGFAEDPFVFHAGSLCRDHPRLILELEYAPRPSNPSYRYGRLG